MKSLSIAAALCLAALSFPAQAASADPSGEWRVADGTATVRIRKCGAAYCGFVATAQTPGRDDKNPDPAKRSRSVIGMQVLINLMPSGNAVWSGTTYNSEDGQMYTAKISLQSDQALQIQGCVPNGGVCGSETWSRVK